MVAGTWHDLLEDGSDSRENGDSESGWNDVARCTDGEGWNRGFGKAIDEPMYGESDANAEC